MPTTQRIRAHGRGYRRMMLVKRFDADARLPTRGTPASAGFDLYACESLVVQAGDFRLVDTGVGITVPAGTYGRIAPRSSMALKGINVGAGVVDRDYTGRVKVLLFNHSKNDVEIGKGDRVAQLIVEKIADDVAVMEVGELVNSQRGAGGFGSTGV